MRLIDADALDEEVMHLFIAISGNPKQNTVVNECKSSFRNMIDEAPTIASIPSDSEYIKMLRWERDIAISQLEDIGCGFGQDMTEVKEKLNASNKELFEKRILFESLSQIMENQRDIMRHLSITKYDSDWGYDDNYTIELITQCNGIVNEIKWREKG